MYKIELKWFSRPDSVKSKRYYESEGAFNKALVRYRLEPRPFIAYRLNSINPIQWVFIEEQTPVTI